MSDPVRHACLRNIDGSWYLDEFTPDYIRQPLLDWLAANGLDGNVIPHDSPITVTRKTITVQEWAKDKWGNQPYQHPDTKEAVRTTRTVPVIVPWPKEWR